MAKARNEAEGCKAWHDDDHGEEQLAEACPERDLPGGRFRAGGEGALHEDEVGTPVAEAENEAEPEDDADDVEWCGLRREGRAGPQMPAGDLGRSGWDNARAETVDGERDEAGQHEGQLEYFVIDRCPDAAEEDVDQHDSCGEENAGGEAEAHDDQQDLSHGIQGNAGEQEHHDRQHAGVEEAEGRARSAVRGIRGRCGCRCGDRWASSRARGRSSRGWRRSSRSRMPARRIARPWR